MYNRTQVFLFALIISICPTATGFGQVTTLSEAIAKTAKSNPRLNSYRHRVAAAEGTITQAKLIPNPELDIEMEEFGGDRDSFNQTETTLALKQPLEIGGKRSARIEEASTNSELVQLEADILVLEVLSNTEIAFAKVQLAQAIKHTLSEQVELSQKMLQIADKKLSAGAIQRVERTKALISLQNDRLALQEAEHDLIETKLALTSLWNGSASELGEVSPATLPADIEQQLSINTVENSPYIKRAEAQHKLAKKQLQLEKTLAIPDLSVGIGYKRFEETNDETFLGTLSIELPFFNRNQGSIAQAEEEVQVKEFSTQSSIIEFAALFQTSQNRLRQLISQLGLLRTGILPSAKQAFNEAELAYRQGRSGYLELVDAQRTLLESRLKKEHLLAQILETNSKIRKLMGNNDAMISHLSNGVAK